MSEPDLETLLSSLTERVTELDRISAEKRKRENLLRTVTHAR
jgi:hypothetical protein